MEQTENITSIRRAHSEILLNQIVFTMHASIDLEPNGRPFGSKSIGNW